MSIVHETPGLIDIRSFTTFGLHAKPNSTNPIGKFGTGLKYAVATLLRLGCKVRVFIGLVEYEFITVDDNVPEGVRELLKYLLRCEIKEPQPKQPGDDEMPF